MTNNVTETSYLRSFRLTTIHDWSHNGTVKLAYVPDEECWSDPGKCEDPDDGVVFNYQDTKLLLQVVVGGLTPLDTSNPHPPAVYDALHASSVAEVALLGVQHIHGEDWARVMWCADASSSDGVPSDGTGKLLTKVDVQAHMDNWLSNVVKKK